MKRKPFTNTQARNIYKVAFETGKMRYRRRKHTQSRMRERGFDIHDFEVLARFGNVIYPPEPDINTGEWKYLIEKDNPTVKAVFIIENGGKGKEQVRIVTVIK